MAAVVACAHRCTAAHQRIAGRDDGHETERIPVLRVWEMPRQHGSESDLKEASIA
jgi:hypothetical protein